MSSSQRGLLLGACARVLVVRTALWVLPSRWIIRYVERLPAPPVPRRSGVRFPLQKRVTPGEIVWAVDTASRRLRDATCVTQAVCALLLLRLHGYDARFCVGATKTHAWLEREGRVLIGRAEQPAANMPDLARTR